MIEQTTRYPKWVDKVQTSPTAKLEELVETLQSQGKKLDRLGLGEPDFDTPDYVKKAAKEAIDHNFSRYTATGGILPLRRAIVSKIKHLTGVEYDPNEILVSVGGKHSIFNAIAALCQEGDEVLIPVPYWVSFPEQVRFIGAVPIFIESKQENGYKITAEELSDYVTSKTKLLILNSPNNPSGAVYHSDELESIANFCIQNDIWVISDEVYSAFNFTKEGHQSIASIPRMRERTIIINSMSKTYSMTGWRIGYSASPMNIAETMLRLQSHTTSNPTSIAQKAALAALTGPDVITPIKHAYAQRRKFLVDGVNRIKGLACSLPDGAFYVWTNISELIGENIAGTEIKNADDLANVLLEEKQIVVMPGTGFGMPNHIRLSFSAPLNEIESGLKKMEQLLGYK
ncbi:pyridoxal phosphate-dependent aminotransferase [Robertmurraya massiliosenegalensis]|uniref:pyridoxal phosphate-dependent aminotransferase n=1 Tax=Robertmurraya TaxID=2837507 RepID=UPI0039A64C9C